MAPTSTESVRDMFTGRDQPVLRCAVYTRQSVANAEQDLTSCDVQRERCENYVRAMQYEGWHLLDEHFDDLGVSGAELSRPGLDKLKSWCVQGRVDIVVATRLDRLNRKMSHWVQLADWFKQAGIELVFVDGGTNARGPLADLVNNIVASFAEFERELVRERLLDAHARLRERGLRSAGRVPLGYKADLATRQLVIDEDEASVVRAFFERCAAGESAASIARWANDAGHRTKVHGRQGGNRWSGRTVLQILRNPIYVGERVHAGGTLEGVHEGIIDADLARRAWRAIEERRTPAARASRPRTGLGPRPVHAPRAPSVRWLRAGDDDERLDQSDHRQRGRGPALLPLPRGRRAFGVCAIGPGLGAEGGGHRARRAQEGRPTHDFRPALAGTPRATTPIVGHVVSRRAKPDGARPGLVDPLEPAARPRRLHPRHHRHRQLHRAGRRALRGPAPACFTPLGGDDRANRNLS